MLRILGALFCLLILMACTTSPLGRKQLLLVPESQMDEMGVQAFQQVKQTTPVDKDPAWNNYVQCIAVPLIQAAKNQLQTDKWEIVVFKSDEVNAFALPGGKVGVYTGILKVAKTPDQLAAVVGHEIGHVIAHHGAERVSENIVAEGGLAAIGAATKDTPNGRLLLGALGVGTQFGVLLPHSRTQESEADLIGLDLMSRAGFDPHQSVDLWKNMMAAGGSAPPEWLSTHPANETRIKNLQSHLPQVLPEYEQKVASGNVPHCQKPAGTP